MYEEDEREPKVLTSDLQSVLRRVVQVDQEGDGPSVATIAEKANTSTRTVYRAIAGTTPHTSLDLADRLCIACGVHLSECRLVWPDGSITGYFDR